jgi:hypothetical protein
MDHSAVPAALADRRPDGTVENLKRKGRQSPDALPSSACGWQVRSNGGKKNVSSHPRQSTVRCVDAHRHCAEPTSI